MRSSSTGSHAPGLLRPSVYLPQSDQLDYMKEFRLAAPIVESNLFPTVKDAIRRHVAPPQVPYVPDEEQVEESDPERSPPPSPRPARNLSNPSLPSKRKVSSRSPVKSVSKRRRMRSHQHASNSASQRGPRSTYAKRFWDTVGNKMKFELDDHMLIDLFKDLESRLDNQATMSTSSRFKYLNRLVNLEQMYAEYTHDGRVAVEHGATYANYQERPDDHVNLLPVFGQEPGAQAAALHGLFSLAQTVAEVEECFKAGVEIGLRKYRLGTIQKCGITDIISKLKVDPDADKSQFVSTSATALMVEKKLKVTHREFITLMYALWMGTIELEVKDGNITAKNNSGEDLGHLLTSAIQKLLAQIPHELHVNRGRCLLLDVQDIYVLFELTSSNVCKVSPLIFRDPDTLFAKFASEEGLDGVLARLFPDLRRNICEELLREPTRWMTAPGTQKSVLGVLVWGLLATPPENTDHFVNGQSLQFPMDLSSGHNKQPDTNESPSDKPSSRQTDDGKGTETAPRVDSDGHRFTESRTMVSPELDTHDLFDDGYINTALPSSRDAVVWTKARLDRELRKKASNTSSLNAGRPPSLVSDHGSDIPDQLVGTPGSTCAPLLPSGSSKFDQISRIIAGQPAHRITLHSLLGSGRLWDAYRAEVYSADSLLGDENSSVVAKVCCPAACQENYDLAQNADQYYMVDAEMAWIAIANEINVLSGPLNDLQGSHVPRLFDRYDGELRLVGNTVRYVLLTMEDCGMNLESSLPRILSLVSPSELCNLVRETYRAIHDRGVIHGDVHPRHTFFDPVTRSVKVIDFEHSKVSTIGDGLEADAGAEDEAVRDMLNEILHVHQTTTRTSA